jgi:hypothetical protein
VDIVAPDAFVPRTHIGNTIPTRRVEYPPSGAVGPTLPSASMFQCWSAPFDVGTLSVLCLYCIVYTSIPITLGPRAERLNNPFDGRGRYLLYMRNRNQSTTELPCECPGFQVGTTPSTSYIRHACIHGLRLSVRLRDVTKAETKEEVIGVVTLRSTEYFVHSCEILRAGPTQYTFLECLYVQGKAGEAWVNGNRGVGSHGTKLKVSLIL